MCGGVSPARRGVCLSTLGPGATNLMTGVADANLDKAPLVAITAQGSLGRLHHESHQYLDVLRLFEPITKWNSAIQTPETVVEIVRKAFKVAQHERPGATHFELSEDMAAQPVKEKLESLTSPMPLPPTPNSKAIENAARLLNAAQRPLIIAGQGATRAEASLSLTNLVEEFMIPITTTFMGKGIVSDESAESLYSIGLGFKDYVHGRHRSSRSDHHRRLRHRRICTRVMES